MRALLGATGGDQRLWYAPGWRSSTKISRRGPRDCLKAGKLKERKRSGSNGGREDCTGDNQNEFVRWKEAKKETPSSFKDSQSKIRKASASEPKSHSDRHVPSKFWSLSVTCDDHNVLRAYHTRLRKLVTRFLPLPDFKNAALPTARASVRIKVRFSFTQNASLRSNGSQKQNFVSGMDIGVPLPVGSQSMKARSHVLSLHASTTSAIRPERSFHHLSCLYVDSKSVLLVGKRKMSHCAALSCSSSCLDMPAIAARRVFVYHLSVA